MIADPNYGLISVVMWSAPLALSLVLSNGSRPHMLESAIQPWMRTTASPAPSVTYRIFTPFESNVPSSASRRQGASRTRPKYSALFSVNMALTTENRWAFSD
jgi:hypothetical protein